MTKQITLKIPDQLLTKISSIQSPSMSRHATILRLIEQGLVFRKAVKVAKEKQSLRKNKVASPRRNSIFDKACYMIGFLGFLILFLLVVKSVSI